MLLIWYVLSFITPLSSTRPPPAKRNKPPIAAKPKPTLPQCKAIYDYDASDTDELTFREGDTIEIVRKGKLTIIAIAIEKIFYTN